MRRRAYAAKRRQESSFEPAQKFSKLLNHCSPHSKVRNFTLDENTYNTILASFKHSTRRNPYTSQIKVSWECETNTICSSCGSPFWLDD